ncbi:hypothetical protein N0V90_009953 [Kalmusia sp. IMI 367209]|nr:hypothetical protein N0V90_009953 [Kalmusia sp. IMI 367209]
MTSFEDLPIELKEAIILETPFRDLNNLSKTCKSIRAITLPAMFRNIDFTWDSTVPDGPAITALLRCILENPNHGKFIKELALRSVNYRGFDAPGFNGDILLPAHTHRISTPDWEMFEKALGGCPCEEKGDCDDPTTREGNLNAGIAVLISYCTRVESLHMDIELLIHNYRLPAMLRSTLYRTLGPWGKQSWFEKLTHLTISYTTPGQEFRYAANLPVPIETFLKFFYLPAIKTLDLTFFPNVSFTDGIQKDTLRHTIWPFPQAPMAFYLTTLQLRRSPALPSTLGLLLATTLSLARLDYDCLIPASQAPLCLETLRQALNRVRRTLKHLTIRYEVFPDDDNETSVANLPRVCVNSLGSLHEFNALETLETSLIILYGQVQEINDHPLVDLLPSSLRRLVMNDDIWAVQSPIWANFTAMEALRRFLTGQRKDNEWYDETTDRRQATWVTDMGPGWKRATPHFAEFTLDMRRSVFNEPVVDLEQACKEQGILFELMLSG